MKQLVGFILPIFASLLANAGQISYSGGDIVICPNTPPRLYDYVESELKWKKQIIPPEGSTLQEKVDSLIERVAQVNPSRAYGFRFWAESFFHETEFISGLDLVGIPDVNDGIIPRGCKIKKVAVQRSPRFPGETRYTIDRDLFSKMSSNDQAGLIFHEMILREAIELRGQDNSINTRYYHTQVASNSLKSLSTEEYVNLINLIGFQFADVNGRGLDISGCASFQDIREYQSGSCAQWRSDLMSSIFYHGDFYALQYYRIEEHYNHGLFQLKPEKRFTKLPLATGQVVFENLKLSDPANDGPVVLAFQDPSAGFISKVRINEDVRLHYQAFNCKSLTLNGPANLGLDANGGIVSLSLSNQKLLSPDEIKSLCEKE